MKHPGFYTLAVLMIFLSSATCNKTDKGNSGNNNHNGGTGNSKPYTTGKNRFVLSVDGDSREYYVHVPLHYNGASAFPVVFMLHGSGGNGEKFYNISGWKEVGDQQNILTVFPSSWQYNCVYDDGVQKPNAEKWSSYDLELCNTSESPKNDIRFFSVVIDEMVQKYNVDANRIYIVGFSNGGEMASRAAIELSGKFAAAVACAGALPADTTLVPVRKLPVLLQAGNSDIKLMNKLGTNDPLPMNINQLFTEFPAIKNVVNLFVNAYELNTTYSTGGNPKRYVYADYIGISGQPENVFRFVLVEGLGHSYPNGNNHPLKAAEVHWDWMKNYHL
jgi:polyhydroxybutyrate depolymerase